LVFYHFQICKNLFQIKGACTPRSQKPCPQRKARKKTHEKKANKNVPLSLRKKTLLHWRDGYYLIKNFLLVIKFVMWTICQHGYVCSLVLVNLHVNIFVMLRTWFFYLVYIMLWENAEVLWSSYIATSELYETWGVHPY
jgi:hypothetical protein